MVAKALLKRYSEEHAIWDAEKLAEVWESFTAEDWQALEDIGPVGAESVFGFIREKKDFLVRLFRELSPAFETAAENAAANANAITDKSFCVTGTLTGHSREEIHAMIEENGGAVRESVSKKLDYLIVGENAGSKRQKALELNVPAITVEEFLIMAEKR